MKKLLALMMALAMILTFAACGGNEEPEKQPETNAPTGSVETPTGSVETPTGEDTTAPENGNATEDLVIEDTTTALEILDFAWMQIGAEGQPAAYGGHIGDDGEYTPGPNSYELAYAEDLSNTLLMPADQMENVIDAATVIHLLNANNMTAGVIKLSEGTDVEAFAAATYKRISENQWMCGFPEKLAIVQVYDNFLFIGFGLVDLINPMVNGMSESWSVNELYNQPLE